MCCSPKDCHENQSYVIVNISNSWELKLQIRSRNRRIGWISRCFWSVKKYVILWQLLLTSYTTEMLFTPLEIRCFPSGIWQHHDRIVFQWPLCFQIFCEKKYPQDLYPKILDATKEPNVGKFNVVFHQPSQWLLQVWLPKATWKAFLSEAFQYSAGP